MSKREKLKAISFSLHESLCCAHPLNYANFQSGGNDTIQFQPRLREQSPVLPFCAFATTDDQHHQIEPLPKTRLVSGRDHRLNHQYFTFRNHRPPAVAQDSHRLVVFPIMYNVPHYIGIAANRDRRKEIPSNDLTAIGAIAEIFASGLRVPYDVSVLGFDNTRLAPHTVPALTTMAQPREQIAELAVDNALRLVNDEEFQFKAHLQCELIVRDSTVEPCYGDSQ